jgi:excisionase family DNA binding protein
MSKSKSVSIPQSSTVVQSLLIDILEAIRANGVPRRYLREDVAAVYLGQTPFFVGELIRSGRIHAIKPPGAKYRVLDVQDLDAFMNAQKGLEPAVPFKATAKQGLDNSEVAA